MAQIATARVAYSEWRYFRTRQTLVSSCDLQMHTSLPCSRYLAESENLHSLFDKLRNTDMVLKGVCIYVEVDCISLVNKICENLTLHLSVLTFRKDCLNTLFQVTPIRCMFAKFIEVQSSAALSRLRRSLVVSEESCTKLLAPVLVEYATVVARLSRPHADGAGD